MRRDVWGVNFSRATKQQLYQIATDNGTELEYRYAAARELQKRKFKPSMLPDLLRLYPKMLPVEVAEHLGVPYQTVEAMAAKLGLKRCSEGR